MDKEKKRTVDDPWHSTYHRVSWARVWVVVWVHVSERDVEWVVLFELEEDDDENPNPLSREVRMRPDC